MGAQHQPTIHKKKSRNECVLDIQLLHNTIEQGIVAVYIVYVPPTYLPLNSTTSISCTIYRVVMSLLRRYYNNSHVSICHSDVFITFEYILTLRDGRSGAAVSWLHCTNVQFRTSGDKVRCNYGANKRWARFEIVV